MTITKVDIDNIKVIIAEIEQRSFDCNSLLDITKGEIEIQKASNNYDKIIVRNISDSIRTIIIDCVEDRVDAISFYGIIEISPKELFEMFKHYREVCSIRDDLYFYFFNEDKKLGNYRVSFFEPSHQQINVVENSKNLANLTINTLK